MKSIQTLTCQFCSAPVRTPEEGQGFRLGRIRFLACHRCAPKVRAAAHTGRNLLVAGARTFLQRRAPGLFEALGMLHAEMRRYDGQQEDDGVHARG